MKANLPCKAYKKEIKNPSEKNQKDFCFYVKLYKCKISTICLL